MEDFDFGDDVLESGLVDKDSGFVRLSALITTMAKQEAAVAKTKAQLKIQEDELRNTQQVLIPNLMDKLDCASHTTKNGMKVTVKRKVRANISDKNRDAAVAWFKAENQDKLLSNDFTLKLPSGKDEEAKKVEEALNATGLPFQNKMTVHHSTLAAFVRGRDAAGEAVPDDLLSVYRYSEAKIG